MNLSELYYERKWFFKSSPEKLWPFVSDTNRLNQDLGLPSLQIHQNQKKNLRKLSFSFFGVPFEWEEFPSEWVRPHRLGMVRNYLKGPIKSFRVQVQLVPQAEDGTQVIYQIWVKPKNILGAFLIPIQFRLFLRDCEKILHRYDSLALKEQNNFFYSGKQNLSAGGQERLKIVREALLKESVSARLVDLLIQTIKEADDLTLVKIKPYVLADFWNVPRREVLELCLLATRAGLLELRWNLLCPMCRGSGEALHSLSEIESKMHCGGCQIDFSVNFERLVEVVFSPNPAIRKVEIRTFCMGSPQHAPHIVLQQLIQAGESREVSLSLEIGRYLLRLPDHSKEQFIQVLLEGEKTKTFKLSQETWSDQEIILSSSPKILFQNETSSPQLVFLERMAWTDQSATAAEVIALQKFRDLFSKEILRSDQQISVGNLAILFTDLRHSTQLYRQIGDAPAFGLVMNHFDVLKKVIAEKEGALVKTIGDAVMAVFRHPIQALQAMLEAQRILAEPFQGRDPLILKAGIHYGPCIAVTLNDRLDYFGTTVNMAARLEHYSSGDDVIISKSVYEDPEVRSFLQEGNAVKAEQLETVLKGFEEEYFQLWKIIKTKLGTLNLEHEGRKIKI